MNNKNLFKILLLFQIIKTIITSCNFEETQNKKINIIPIKNITEYSHPLKISFDYSNLNKEEINILNQKFEKISNYFSKLLEANNKIKIKTTQNIKSLCENKFEKYDKINIEKGYNSDLLIIPFINNNINDIRGGICAYSNINLKPIISYLQISNKYLNSNLNKENNQNIIIEIMHQIFHILGFTKNIMKQLPNLNKHKSSIYYENIDNNIKIAKLATVKTLLSGRIVLKDKNLNGIEIEASLEHDFFSPHWSRNLNLNDIMLNSKNNIYNNHISMITISFFEETTWYSQSLIGCNFIQKFNDYYCVFFKEKCLTQSNPFYHLSYFIDNNNLHCFLNKKNSCWREYNINEEIKIRNYIKNLNNEKCSLNQTEEEINEIINKYPELNKYSSQKLKLIKPLEQCKCKQKTIFFSYHPLIEEKQYIDNNYIIKEKEIIDKRYMVLYFLPNYKKNNYFCVKEPLKYNNIIPSKIYENVNLIWSNKLLLLYMDTLNKYQKHNHFITYSQLAINSNLYKNYKLMHEKYQNEYNYMPYTFIFPKDAITVFTRFNNYKLDINDLWIIKSKDTSNGKGIKILKNINEINKNKILSEYISNPLLIDGKKFDLRYYLLVTSHNPLRLYLYEDGLTRIASEKYSLDLDKIDNLFIHLTTSSINKKNKKYKINSKAKSKDSNTWSILILKKYLISNGINYNIILEKIKDIAIKSLISVSNIELNAEDKIKMKENNLFELYAFDILIDTNLKPWLIDFNYNPSLNIESDLNKKLKTKMFTDMYNILGLKPYNHINNLPLEKQCKYLNDIEKKIDESICEFLRPSGSFERIFPRYENIDKYDYLFELPSKENKFLWKKLKEIKL